jgi:hypothetical protein
LLEYETVWDRFTGIAVLKELHAVVPVGNGAAQQGEEDHGTAKLKPSSPNHKGEFLSCKISQHWPTFCIQVPTFDTIRPAQRSVKLRLRRAAKRAWGGTGEFIY